MDRFSFGVYSLSKSPLDQLNYDLKPYYVAEQNSEKGLKAPKVRHKSHLKQKIKRFILSNNSTQFSANFKDNVLEIQSKYVIRDMQAICKILFSGNKKQLKNLPKNVMSVMKRCFKKELFSSRQVKFFSKAVCKFFKIDL